MKAVFLHLQRMIAGLFLVASPAAQAETYFSCSDVYSDHQNKAVISGVVYHGGEKKHDFNVKAEFQSLYLFQGERLRMQDTFLNLKGQGFITATGSHQFDFSSTRKVGATKLSFQLSLKNRDEVVYSYLTVEGSRYRTICSATRPSVPGFAVKQ